MGSESNTIIDATGEGFDAERETLNIDGTSAYLLLRSGQTEAFTPVIRLTSAWKNVFSTFRGVMNLQIATTDEDIVLAIKKCSDMSINGYVYEIDNRDKMEPDGDRPWWDLYGTKTDETFTTEEDPIPLDGITWTVSEW